MHLSYGTIGICYHTVICRFYVVILLVHQFNGDDKACNLTKDYCWCVGRDNVFRHPILIIVACLMPSHHYLKVPFVLTGAASLHIPQAVAFSLVLLVCVI